MNMKWILAEIRMSTGLTDTPTAAVCLAPRSCPPLWVRFCDFGVFDFYSHRYGIGALDWDLLEGVFSNGAEGSENIKIQGPRFYRKVQRCLLNFITKPK